MTTQLDFTPYNKMLAKRFNKVAHNLTQNHRYGQRVPKQGYITHPTFSQSRANAMRDESRRLIAPVEHRLQRPRSEAVRDMVDQYFLKNFQEKEAEKNLIDEINGLNSQEQLLLKEQKRLEFLDRYGKNPDMGKSFLNRMAAAAPVDPVSSFGFNPEVTEPVPPSAPDLGFVYEPPEEQSSSIPPAVLRRGTPLDQDQDRLGFRVKDYKKSLADVPKKRRSKARQDVSDRRAKHYSKHRKANTRPAADEPVAGAGAASGASASSNRAAGNAIKRTAEELSDNPFSHPMSGIESLRRPEKPRKGGNKDRNKKNKKRNRK